MTPRPGEGVPVAQSLIAAARRHLGMDLSFVAEFTGGRRVFRFIDSAPGEAQLKAGDSDELGVAADIEASHRMETDQQSRRARLERAISQEEFAPVYQPIIDVGTGRIVGAEALTRFTGDDRSPLAWFAEAATVELGTELQVATARAALAGFDAPGVFCALNLSPSALTALPEVLAGSRVDPQLVVVELTEQIEVTDYTELQTAIATARESGVRIAVDDTGSGISSLHHILEVQPDFIKLDLSLTRGIDTDLARQALARALITFGADIDAVVVAEGIERAEELEAIEALGLPLAQGFHICRPGPLPLHTTL